MGQGVAVYRVCSPAEFKLVVCRFGSPLPVSICASLAEVSRSRIYNLIDFGRFTRLVVFGQVMVGSSEFSQWREGRVL